VGRHSRTSRSTVNFWVDAGIGAAFLVTSVTGIVKYLPPDWLGGSPPLGIHYPLWTAVHDWSGFLMVGGILLHAALHWRWIVATAGRTFAAGRAERGASPPTPAAASASGLHPAATGDLRPVRQPAGRAAGAAGSRFTRRRFLAGAAVAVAAAAVGVAVGRASAGLDALGASRESGASADDESGDVSAAKSTGSPTASGSGATTTTVTTRVAVDSSRCVGCGRCLDACPVGVFAAGSDRSYAVAQDPDACRLCGRCVRVCPAGAITLSA